MFKLLTHAVVLPSLLVGTAASMAATNWDVSLWSKRRAFTEHVEKIAELVSKKTNGEFTLSISYGGLSKPKENLDAISIGAFEMAQFCSFYHKDKNPTITVVELPFSKNLTLRNIADISSQVYQHPEVKKDLARWGATLLMPSPLPQYNLVGKGDAPVKLSDFKGKRVRGTGGITDVLGHFGAVKTGLAANEVRQALNSGVIDTVAFAQHAHMAFGSIEVGKWATSNLNLGSADCPVVVNTKALDGLKPEYRDALLGSVDEALNHYIDNYENNVIGKYNAKIKEKNIDVITFTPDQVKELGGIAQPVKQKWVADNAKKFDSKGLYEFTQNLVDSASAK